ncbi:MAG: TolC family protein [Sinimarinibacterium flocculans]|uniref:TolC family protein n=1 Tax=Sinimarinibacterium flocculans TaxID=985250 RepID=UPI003C524DD0
MRYTVPRGRLASVFVAAVLTGCATAPADRGLSEVQGLLKARDPTLASAQTALSADPESIDTQMATLMAAPLTADRALSVALLKSPRLRVIYAQLGLAQADWLDASRLSNPVLSFSALESSASGERTRLGYGLVQNFTDLLFLRSRSRIAAHGRDQVEADAAAAIQDLAAEVLSRYYEAVGAAQTAQMRRVIAHAATASADLAQRFKDAGNINALELAREKAAAHRAVLEQESAEAEASSAALALNEAMGLSPPLAWTLDPQLALPVDETLSTDALVASALQQRLDLLAKQREIDAIEGALGLARTLRWIPFVEVGLEGEREGDGSRLLGPTVAIEIPLFGKSQSEVLRMQARREQAIAEAEAIRAEVANGVATALTRMQAAQARVQRFREGLIPQSEAVVARMQELQNYMIVGQFELLVAKQEEYEAYAGYLDTLRDYWLARVALQHAVGAALPANEQDGSARIGAIRLPDAAAGGGHSMHTGMHHGASHQSTGDAHAQRDMHPPAKSSSEPTAPPRETDAHAHH